MKVLFLFLLLSILSSCATYQEKVYRCSYYSIEFQMTCKDSIENCAALCQNITDNFNFLNLTRKQMEEEFIIQDGPSI